MISRPITRKTLLAASLLTLSFAAAAPAASAKTTLNLTVPGQADAGKKLPFSYTAKGVNGKLVVQRPKGTSGTWTTVATLKNKKAGSGQLAAQPLGEYRYRLAVVKSKRKLVKSSSRSVRVFGTLPLADALGGGGYKNTLVLPTGTFTYVYEGRAFATNVRTMFSQDAAKSFCRSVHLDWVSVNDSDYVAVRPPVLSVISEDRDPVANPSAPKTISGFDAPLTVGKSWGVLFAGSAEGGSEGYLNGSASCFRTAGTS